MVDAATLWPPGLPEGVLPAGTVHVWFVDIADTAGQLTDLRRLLSPAEGARADRFQVAAAAHRFVLARARLRQLLGIHLGQAPRTIAIANGPHGKPRCADAVGSGLEFNVSHSGESILLAVSNGRSVGVDIETLRPDLDVQALSQRFLALEEQEAIAAASGADRLAAFYRCWTRKEALLKAIGTGLATPLRQAVVSVAARDRPAVLRLPAAMGPAAHWHLRDLELAPDQAAALCVAGPVKEVICRSWQA
jgi:4'-phosphopantetheinyl transferase